MEGVELSGIFDLKHHRYCELLKTDLSTCVFACLRVHVCVLCVLCCGRVRHMSHVEDLDWRIQLKDSDEDSD